MPWLDEAGLRTRIVSLLPSATEPAAIDRLVSASVGGGQPLCRLDGCRAEGVCADGDVAADQDLPGLGMVGNPGRHVDRPADV